MSEFAELRSTRGSLLHSLRVLTNRPPAGDLTVSVWRVWLCFGGGWYLVMTVAALLELPSPWTPAGETRLAYLLDANAAFAFVVSLPVLSYFLLTDDALLRGALEKLVAGGVLESTPSAAGLLVRKWNARFARFNSAAQSIALVVAVLVGLGNHVAYANAESGFWMIVNGRVALAGWLYIVGIAGFYWIVCVFVLRTFAMTWFLRDLVRDPETRLHVLPFHPDNCGGLRPVGQIALRSQYTLTILGVNLAILVWLTFRYLGAQPGIVGLVMVAVVAYLCLGPVVFLAPLLPFRQGMISARAAMLTLVAREAAAEVQELTTALNEHRIREFDIEGLERINRVGDLISKQPIWPFDVTTLRKFLTAYLVPMAGFGVALLLNAILEGLVSAMIR